MTMRELYLDHAATALPKAPGVADAVAQALTGTHFGNPGRGSHRQAVEAQRLIDTTRRAAAELLGEPDPDRVAFTAGCTDSLNLAIDGVLAQAEPSEHPLHVVTTQAEHNAVTRPLWHRQQTGRIELTTVPCGADAAVDSGAVAQALRPDTALVALQHASNVTGAVQDIPAVAQAIQERCPEARLLVDAAQTAGVLRLSAHELGADLLAFGAHKGLAGPTGIGGLWVHPRVGTLPGWRRGGTGTDSNEPAMPSRMPECLESGTANTTALAGLQAALLQPHAKETTLNTMLAWMDGVMNRTSASEGLTWHASPHDRARVPVACVSLRGWDPAELAAALDTGYGIQCRAGLHCAPGVHRAMGTLATGGALRVSPGPDVKPADADRLVSALTELAGA